MGRIKLGFAVTVGAFTLSATSAAAEDFVVAAGMEGQLAVRITVNASGKPSSCFVTSSNNPQLLDDAVCLGLMRRARFEPARNASGEPVASYFTYGVTFSIR